MASLSHLRVTPFAALTGVRDCVWENAPNKIIIFMKKARAELRDNEILDRFFQRPRATARSAGRNNGQFIDNALFLREIGFESR